MSSSILGKVVNEAGVGIPSLIVHVLSVNGLHGDVELGVGSTDGSGAFSFSFTPASEALHPMLQVRVYAAVMRLVAQSDVQNTASVNVIANFIIPSALVNGLPVTGKSDTALYFSSGNHIEFLIDNESAWTQLTDAVHKAKQSIHLQPFGFDISEFRADIHTAEPTLITKFTRPPVAQVRTEEVQLESELADAASRMNVTPTIPVPVHVRVLMHHAALWRPFTFNLVKFWLQLFDLALALGLPDDSKKAEAYFAANAAGPPPRRRVEVRQFGLDRPTHAKLAIVDDQAFVLGSPLAQEYFDTTSFKRDSTGAALPQEPTHVIDELRRGSGGSSRRPIHDVSLLVRGPAVADIDRAFLLHWNDARPDKNVPGEFPAPAPPPVTPGVNVQIVRSLCEGRFKDVPNAAETNPDVIKGEEGVLEAYQRAIGSAKRFIYLENQYFVDTRITSALIAQMKAEKDLQLILLMNNWADVPFYSSSLIPVLFLVLDFIQGRQQNRLEELLKALTPAGFNARVGAYTLWTHEDANANARDKRPRIINNYLHSKVAIIDDVWATVGSANLDVFSLSREDNSEVNAVLFGDAREQIADFRRRLWAEHLGLTPSQIEDGSNFGDLWRQQANSKVAGLKEAVPRRTNPRILPFPPFPHKNANIAANVFKPGKYLAGLDIDTRKFQILEAETAFNFADGKVTESQ